MALTKADAKKIRKRNYEEVMKEQKKKFHSNEKNKNSEGMKIKKSKKCEQTNKQNSNKITNASLILPPGE